VLVISGRRTVLIRHAWRRGAGDLETGGVCTIVDDPRSIDGDIKAKLKTATLKYVSTQYLDTTQALENLYQEESELGSLLRKAVEVIADRDASDDPIRAPVSDHHASKVADLQSRGRRGPKKAICAVAASILTAAYHMLKDGTFYEDLGAVHFDRRRPETQARRLVKRLAELGFSVELKPAAAVS
jgi:hypothetical protein